MMKYEKIPNPSLHGLHDTKTEKWFRYYDTEQLLQIKGIFVEFMPHFEERAAAIITALQAYNINAATCFYEVYLPEDELLSALSSHPLVLHVRKRGQNALLVQLYTDKQPQYLTQDGPFVTI